MTLRRREGWGDVDGPFKIERTGTTSASTFICIGAIGMRSDVRMSKVPSAAHVHLNSVFVTREYGATPFFFGPGENFLAILDAFEKQ